MIAGVPLRMTLTQGRVRARAPLLDEHADDIRAEFTRAAPSLQKTSNQDQTQ